MNITDILISEDLSSPAIDRLEQKYTVIREPLLWQEQTRLVEELSRARSLMVRNQTRVTAELLASAPQLIGIGRVGVGLDNIDVVAATNLGIVVVAPLNANAVSVAELALGLLIALARKIPQGDRTTKAGGWDRKACTGIELDSKTLGVCGFGRIGRVVASRARAFGLRVLAFDPFVAPGTPGLLESGVTLCTGIEQLLAESDFVSVHSPLTPETRHLFNTRTFHSMKRGAFFINTSRGGVVDEAALLAALQSGQLGAAALDVREVEPPTVRSALESMENVILTPHIGAFTIEAQRRTFEAVADDLDKLLSGGLAVNHVNIQRPHR
jgi:D-3-phosphoglycerate dehydrogenase / 2-oxoglutarate reductase